MKILRPEDVRRFPPFRDFSAEELKEAYALARAAFSVEDLVRYADDDEGIPAQQVLAELEEAQRQADQGKA